MITDLGSYGAAILCAWVTVVAWVGGAGAELGVRRIGAEVGL